LALRHKHQQNFSIGISFLDDKLIAAIAKGDGGFSREYICAAQGESDGTGFCHTSSQIITIKK
jgi:hypothetical protein